MKTTKILLYDLEENVQKIIQDLIDIQGTYESLKERLTNINPELFDPDTKAVIKDLIDSFHRTNKHLSERLEDLKLESDEGNYDEVYEYDSDGDVIRHVVSGDKNYTITYHYSENENKELMYSEKTYRNSKGEQVTIRKNYTYDETSNIRHIQTTTTIMPSSEEGV